MRIYFGEASERSLQDFGADGLIEKQYRFYAHMAEFGSNSGGFDDIMLYDGCNRNLPIAVEHIPQLIKALGELHTISEEIRVANDLREFAESKDSTATVCEYGHIHY